MFIIRSWFIPLCVGISLFATSCYLTLPASGEMSEPVSVPEKKEQPSFLSKIEKQLGNASNWSSYPLLNPPTRLPRAAKVIFVVEQPEPHLLIVKKKAHSKRSAKHKKWEFPGGQAEAHNDKKPLDALDRELAEEDPTGILRKEMEKALTRGDVYYRYIQYRDRKRPDWIAVVPLSKEIWTSLDEQQKEALHKHDEVLRYQLIPIEDVHRKDHSLTHRTRKMLTMLQKQGPSP